MQETAWNAAPREPFDGHPGVRLAFALDDEDDPTEVTVYPERCADVTTTWITVDVEHAVDLRDAV